MDRQAEFLHTFRSDLAALCCAGAFVSQPHVWASFTEWIKGTEPEFKECDFDDEKNMAQMLSSVCRTDRVIMLSALLAGTPDDLDIRKLLEGEDDS